MLIDILLAIFLGLSFYLGYSKGIVKSFFGIMSILIATLVTLKFSFILIALLENISSIDPRLALVLGFLFTFLIVVFTIRLIGRGFEKFLETAQINFINKFIGGVMSAVIVLTLYSSMIWFLNQIRFIDSSTKEESQSYSLLESLPEKTKWVWSKTKPLFSEFWEKTNHVLDSVELPASKSDDTHDNQL
ncbi:MAG: CvpA family protein [Saprospiraceae bacterium]|nr:CvpA family protein [Saprospiraceae bacterium]